MIQNSICKYIRMVQLLDDYKGVHEQERAGQTNPLEYDNTAAADFFNCQLIS